MTRARTKIQVDNAEVNSEITKLGEGDVRNLYEHIVEIKESIGRIEAKVDIHNNYEKRISRLEKGFWISVGAIIIINFIANMGVILLIKFLRA